MINLFLGSGKGLSKLIPLSNIKTCLETEKEAKVGMSELIFDIIISLSASNLKHEVKKCLLSSMSPQKHRSLLDKFIVNPWLFK